MFRNGLDTALAAFWPFPLSLFVTVPLSMSEIFLAGYSPAEIRGKAFTESDWSKTGAAHISAYEKSKTLAEQAAWDFVKNIKGAQLVDPEILTLSVIG